MLLAKLSTGIGKMPILSKCCVAFHCNKIKYSMKNKDKDDDFINPVHTNFFQSKYGPKALPPEKQQSRREKYKYVRYGIIVSVLIFFYFAFQPQQKSDSEWVDSIPELKPLIDENKELKEKIEALKKKKEQNES